LNAYDIQDNENYHRLIEEVPISKAPVIRTLVKIVGHRAFFDESDEMEKALVKIITETQPEPFWTYLSVLLQSSSTFYKKVIEYLTANDMGENFPLWQLVTIEKNNTVTYGVISAFHDLTRERYEVSKEDGTVDFYKASSILEFKTWDVLCVQASPITCAVVDTKYLNYVNPKNRKDMLKRPDKDKWIEAENEELKRCIEFEYFKEFRRTKPEGVFVHTMRLVYQLQLLSDGSLWKYKCRMVFRGFSAVWGRDYTQSFAPVTQITSIKLFFVCTAYYGLDYCNIDIKSAFLQPLIDVDLWAELPEGILIKGCKYVKLNKPVPGTPQAAWLWYLKFVDVMQECGFTRANVEPCLFYYFGQDKPKTICLILVHVDNALVSCNSESFKQEIVKQMEKHFPINVMSSTTLLGLRIERVSRYRFHLTQDMYIEGLIKEYKLEHDGKIVKIPIKPGIEKRFPMVEMKKITHPDKNLPYRRLTMQIYWVARSTHNHILFAVHFFAMYCTCYNDKLYEELLDLLRFIAQIRLPHVLSCKPGGEMSFRFLCDSNYANMDSKTTIGVLGYLNESLIYADCSTLKTIVTSSSEGESHAIYSAAKASVYCTGWLREIIGDKLQLPTFIFNDNESAITILSTRSNSGRSKHYDVKLRYVTYLMEQGKINVAYVKRKENCADILTHPLPAPEFIGLLEVMYGPGVHEAFHGGSYRSGGVTKVASLTIKITDSKELIDKF
jgi:hypothetical protein